MGGFFGTLARTAGGIGNEVANAKTYNDQLAVQAAKDKLAQIMGQLQVHDLQNRLSEFGQPKPSGVERGPNGEITGIVFNPKTGQYEAQNIAAGQAPAGIDKEKFRNQLLQQANDPNASAVEKKVLSGLIGSLDSGGLPEKVMEDYNRFLSSRSETGTEKQEKPETVIFGGNRYQWDPTKKIPGPRDATGQYVRLGPAKEPGESGGVDLDAYAQDVAEGKASLPTGKFGAQVANRMKQLGLDAPKKKDVPQDVKNLLLAPVPPTPSAADSQRLAAAADKVFGGTEHRQDLISRGRRSTLMGLRTPYAPQAYSADEYQMILDSIKQAVGGPTEATPPPPSGYHR
jgi:hypothetical protein